MGFFKKVKDQAEPKKDIKRDAVTVIYSILSAAMAAMFAMTVGMSVVV